MIEYLPTIKSQCQDRVRSIKPNATLRSSIESLCQNLLPTYQTNTTQPTNNLIAEMLKSILLLAAATASLSFASPIAHEERPASDKTPASAHSRVTSDHGTKRRHARRMSRYTRAKPKIWNQASRSSPPTRRDKPSAGPFCKRAVPMDSAMRTLA